MGRELDAEAAYELGLVTFIPDDIDWEDEVRLALEERASFLARCADRHGSESALRRTGDDGEQDFRKTQRVAELDIPATQRIGQPGSVAGLRHWREGGV